jgi:hypothetical protein
LGSSTDQLKAFELSPEAPETLAWKVTVPPTVVEADSGTTATDKPEDVAATGPTSPEHAWMRNAEKIAQERRIDLPIYC